MPVQDLKRLHSELKRVEESLDSLLKSVPKGTQNEAFWVDAQELKYRIRRVDFAKLLEQAELQVS